MPDEITSPPEALEAAPEARAAGAAAEPPASQQSEAEQRLQRERDEYYDLLLRTRAEFDNYRKRVERDRLEQAEAAAADLLRDMLPVVDDLERALAVSADAGEEARAYREGIELIHRRMLDILRQHGARPVEALGATFDPHVHQAVSHEAAPGRREGEVIEEYRRGYMLGDRLLRPSMVKVAAGE
jgi:molecular chaperone GrpE